VGNIPGALWEIAAVLAGKIAVVGAFWNVASISES